MIVQHSLLAPAINILNIRKNAIAEDTNTFKYVDYTLFDIKSKLVSENSIYPICTVEINLSIFQIDHLEITDSINNRFSSNKSLQNNTPFKADALNFILFK
jgi:hypothetical protein